jgi:DNA adenine methylase
MTPEELKARRNEQTRKYRAAKKAQVVAPVVAPAPAPAPAPPPSPTSVVDAPYGYTASGRIRKKPIKETTERRETAPSRSLALQKQVEDERIKKYTESSIKFRQLKMTPAERKADVDYLAKIRGEDDPLIIKLREQYKPIEKTSGRKSDSDLTKNETEIIALMYPKKDPPKRVDIGGSITNLSGDLFILNRLRYNDPNTFVLPYYTDVVEKTFTDKIKINRYDSSGTIKLMGVYESVSVLAHRSGYFLDPTNTNKVLGFWLPAEPEESGAYGTILQGDNKTFLFPKYYSQQWLDGKYTQKWIDLPIPMYNYKWQDPDGNEVQRNTYAKSNHSLYDAFLDILEADEYINTSGLNVLDVSLEEEQDKLQKKYVDWFNQLYALFKKRKVVFCEDKIRMMPRLLHYKGKTDYPNKQLSLSFQQDYNRNDLTNEMFYIKHGIFIYADYFLNLQAPPDDYIGGQKNIALLPLMYNLWLKQSNRIADRLIDKIYRDFRKQFLYYYASNNSFGEDFVPTTYNYIEDLFFNSRQRFAQSYLKDEQLLDWFATPEGAEKDAKKAGVFNEYMIDNEKKSSYQPRDINRDTLLEWVQLPADVEKKDDQDTIQSIFKYLEKPESDVSGKGLYEEWHAMPAGANKDAKAKELFGLVKGGKIPTTPEELDGAVAHGSTHLRPPFCRNGNKYPVKDILVKQFPEHKKYVEPFTGSSALFFNKAKAEQNVLNDLDKRMIQSLRWLKSAPPKDDPEWDKIEFKGSFGTGKDQRLSGTRLANARAFFAKVPNSIIEKMAHFKLAGCAGFNGVFANKPSQIYKVSEKPLQRIETYLDLYKEYLKGVSLETKDYANIIKQHDGADTFFFIDPPYENTSSSLGYAEGKGFDFERLRETLEKVKGKFLMTLNDSPNIRKIFQQFKINGFSAPNPWNTRDDKADRKPRKEITIRNY